MGLLIEILNKSHLKDNFDCGNSQLDNYLKSQASQDVKRNISICYVMTDYPERIISGYYTLSSNSIPLQSLPDKLRKKLPPSYKEIPTALLGRLAVSKNYQGRQIGKILLVDALNRCAGLSDSIGTLAVIVDPIDEQATNFYSAFGFINLPGSQRMFISTKTIKASY